MRRTIVPSSSPIAKGIIWQWEGDIPGTWCDFDLEVIEYLDTCFLQGQQIVLDLSVSKFRLPYYIDLGKMTQTRIHTGRVRKIQRVFSSMNYPTDSSSAPSGSKRQSTASSQSGSKKTRSSAVLTSSSIPSATFPPSTAGTSPAVTSLAAPGLTSNPHLNVNPVTLPNASLSSIPNFSFGSASVASSAPFSFMASVSPFTNHRGPVTRRRHLMYTQGLSNTLGPTSLGPQNQGGVQSVTNSSTNSLLNLPQPSLTNHNLGFGSNQSHNLSYPPLSGGPYFGPQGGISSRPSAFPMSTSSYTMPTPMFSTHQRGGMPVHG